MNNHFSVFDIRMNNEEMENEFHNFFHRNNLDALFTNEHRAGSISVTYIDVRSVIVDGGKYNNLLKELTDVLLISTNNKSYEEALFQMLYDSRSFQSLMNKVRKLIQFVKTADDDEIENLWNIVFYTDVTK